VPFPSDRFPTAFGDIAEHSVSHLDGWFGGAGSENQDNESTPSWKGKGPRLVSRFAKSDARMRRAAASGADDPAAASAGASATAKNTASIARGKHILRIARFRRRNSPPDTRGKQSASNQSETAVSNSRQRFPKAKSTISRTTLWAKNLGKNSTKACGGTPHVRLRAVLGDGAGAKVRELMTILIASDPPLTTFMSG
jgi:hypothetical protein